MAVTLDRSPQAWRSIFISSSHSRLIRCLTLSHRIILASVWCINDITLQCCINRRAQRISLSTKQAYSYVSTFERFAADAH